jgi:ADP-ribose pyrophosphatase YjhB (NUDIX family)
MQNPHIPAYCPMCANPLVERYVEVEERDRLVCERCAHIHYLNPKIVAGTIPVHEGAIWLLRRAIEPRIGFWTFPAGYMEMNETVEEAAARETWEELRLRVSVGALLGVYSRSGHSTVHIVYLAQALSGAAPGPEALEIALFRHDQIPWDELAFPSTHDALRDWVRTLS